MEKIDGLRTVTVNPILGCDGLSMLVPLGYRWSYAKYHHLWMIIDNNRRVITPNEVPALSNIRAQVTENEGSTDYLALAKMTELADFKGVKFMREESPIGVPDNIAGKQRFYVRLGSLRYRVVEQDEGPLFNKILGENFRLVRRIGNVVPQLP